MKDVSYMPHPHCKYPEGVLLLSDPGMSGCFEFLPGCYELTVPRLSLPDNFEQMEHEYQVKEVLSAGVYLGYITHWNAEGTALDASCLPK